MTATEEDAALARYFEEANAWDRNRLAQAAQSARRAWQVSFGAAICAICAALALALMLPLKSVEPFLIRVDSTTGVVDVVPAFTGRLNLPDSVTRYFLTHYVSVCERFNYAMAESDYQECGAFHTARRNELWYALWNPNNPASPLNLHRDGSSISVDIESVSFLARANGVADLAQVRYRKTEHNASGGTQRVTHWIATIQYAYAPASADPAVRRWNPLGFRVVNFVTEPEVWMEPPESAASGAVRRAR